MNELDLLKLHLLNSIDENLEGFVFYQLLVNENGESSFLFLSDQIKKYNTHPIEEIKRNPSLLYEKVHPDYIENLRKEQQYSREHLVNFNVEFPIYVNDHELKWLSVTSAPIKTDNNAVIWNGVQIDITEKKRQELEIKKQNRILLLLNSVNDKILKYHDNEELLYKIVECIVDKGSYKLVWIGLKPESNSKDQLVKVYKAYGETSYLDEIKIDLNDPQMKLGPTARTLFYKEISVTNNMTNSANFKPWLEIASKYGLRASAVFPLLVNGIDASINIYSDEIDAFNKDEVELLERIIKNINNAILSNINSLEKLESDRLLAEKINELKSSEANLQTVFNHTKIRYSLLDRDFNVLMMNEGFRRDFEAVNKFEIQIGDSLLKKINVDRKYELMLMVDKLKNKTIPFAEYEMKYLVNEEDVYANITYFPVFVNNQLSSFLIVSEDVTERKKYEIERQSMIDDLLLRNEKLEKFAFIVSHVLRAPVANIMGLNSLLNEDPTNYHQYIKLLDDSVHKLDEVIRDLNRTIN